MGIGIGAGPDAQVVGMVRVWTRGLDKEVGKAHGLAPMRGVTSRLKPSPSSQAALRWTCRAVPPGGDGNGVGTGLQWDGNGVVMGWQWDCDGIAMEW